MRESATPEGYPNVATRGRGERPQELHARAQRGFGVPSHGDQQQIERERRDSVLRRGERHARGARDDHEAATAEARMSPLEREQSSVGVSSARRDLEGHRRGRMVEDEVDFVVVLTPVKQSMPRLLGERVEVTRHEVLDEVTCLVRFRQRSEAS